MDDRGAIFNEARTHRYKLWRTWDSKYPSLFVVGTNPSKADEKENDPTIERCVRRGKLLGYGGICMINMQDVIESDFKCKAFFWFVPNASLHIITACSHTEIIPIAWQWNKRKN